MSMGLRCLAPLDTPGNTYKTFFDFLVDKACHRDRNHELQLMHMGLSQVARDLFLGYTRYQPNFSLHNFHVLHTEHSSAASTGFPSPGDEWPMLIPLQSCASAWRNQLLSCIQCSLHTCMCSRFELVYLMHCHCLLRACFPFIGF